jgi:polysaccharide export outer membrane protein
MRQLIRATLYAAGLGFLLLGCAATTTTESLKVEVEVLDVMNRYEAAYLLQAGDQLEVFIYRHPELSRKAIIRPDGFISLPLVGEIQAAGKAPRDLSSELVTKFGDRIKNPEITVIVENPQEPMVFVLGEVGAPKAVPLRQARTAAQALALAGNATKSAELSSMAIVRLNSKGMLEATTVKSDGVNQPELYMALHNMLLKPNDLVFVPESYRGQIVRLIQDVNTMMFPYYQYRLLQQVIQ